MYKRFFQKEKIVNASIVSLVAVLLVSLSACATWDGQTYKGKTGSKGSKSDGGSFTREVPVEKEIKRPGATQVAAISSPARKASNNMIIKGKKHLANANYEKAATAFREAVIIDGTNGVAYYYMAKARFNLDQHEQALGILDKAESLLTDSEEWTEAISLLRSQIEKSYLAE